MSLFVIRLCLILSLILYSSIYSAIDFTIKPIKWTDNSSKGYDFTKLNPYYYPISVSILSTENDPYYYFITFSSNSTSNKFDDIIIDGNFNFTSDEITEILPSRYATYKSAKLRYQFYQTPETTIPLSEQIKNDFSMIRKYITYGGNTTLFETFFMSVPPNQHVSPGIYTDLAIISLYQGPTEFLSDATLIARKKIPVSITVLGISEITVFDYNKTLMFDNPRLLETSPVTLEYKFLDNQDASLWLESDIGNLSLSGNAVIYSPTSSTAKSNSVRLFPIKTSPLQSLTIAVSQEFYKSNVPNTANIKTQIIQDVDNSITNKIIYDDSLSDNELQLVPTFNDTINLIIKVD
tara:strand:+ start:1152 stop:2201 length:1050 start_codon:yes stop_codon:yes gene_type:complete